MTALSTSLAVPPHDDLPLSAVLPDFLSRGYSLPLHANYQALWRAVVNGRIPAQLIGNRYRMRRGDLPLVEAFFQILGPEKAPAAPRASRKAVAAPVPVAA